MNVSSYILTGDKAGTDLALSASFHREFTHGIPAMSEVFLDKVEGHIHSLGPKLRKKTIPESQVFKIRGLSLDSEEGRDWSPH